MEGTGIAFYNSVSASSVSNCEFTRTGRAGVQIDLRNSGVGTNVLITACDIHDYVRWGIDLVCNSPGCTMKDIVIDGNRIRDDYQYAPGTWLGVAAGNPHFDGIIMRLGNWPPYTNQTLGSVSQPIVVRNNSFYNNSATAVDAGTAMMFLTAFGGRVLIHDNIFINTLSCGYGSIYIQDGLDPTSGSTLPDYLIFNNTFLDARNMVALRTVSGTKYAITNGTVRIKNNLFCKTDSGGSYAVECGLDGCSTPRNWTTTFT